MGAIVTFLFLPDVTGLDLRVSERINVMPCTINLTALSLKEQERRWRYCMAGKPEEYHGIAVHRRHLSWWEVHVLKQHLQYDAKLDKEQRLAEMRQTYIDEVRAAQQEEKGVGRIADEDSDLPPAIHRIFEDERMSSTDNLLPSQEKFIPSGRLGRTRPGGAIH